MILTAATRATTVRLRRPVLTAQGPIADRTALLLEVTDEHGHRGAGEVAPLPGWSTIDVAQAATELDAWIGGLGDGTAEVPVSVASAETCAGIDTALWNLGARIRGVPLWRVIARRRGADEGDAAATVAVNQLVAAATPAEVAEAVGTAVHTGYGTIKLKMGFDDDKDRLRALSGALDEHVRVRLDANAAWSLDQAVVWAGDAAELLGDRLEYLEDPVSTLRDLRQLRAAVPVPLAVDDLVGNAPDLDAVLAEGLADVLVVKPALLGGITPVIDVAERAADVDVDVVVSSLYDGPVGLAAWCHLAAGLHADRAHGLGTADLLDDPAAAPLVPRSGVIRLEPAG